MSHQLSFEAAAALKAANFPQPAPAPGQYWYTEDGRLLWLHYISKYSWRETVALFRSIGNIGNSVEYSGASLSALAYCPTAEDILRDMGGNYGLSFHKGKWQCVRTKQEVTDGVYTHESAAEACAMAWIEMNKKKSKT